MDFRLFEQLSQETRHLAMMIDRRLGFATATLRRLSPLRCDVLLAHLLAATSSRSTPT